MVIIRRNPDGSIAVVLFNPSESSKGIELELNGEQAEFSIAAKAVQTVLIPAKMK